MARRTSIMAGDSPPPEVSDYQRRFPGSAYYQGPAPTIPVPWFTGNRINYTQRPPMLPAQPMIPWRQRGYEFPPQWEMPNASSLWSGQAQTNTDAVPWDGQMPTASPWFVSGGGGRSGPTGLAGSRVGLPGVGGTASSARGTTPATSTLPGQPPVSGQGGGPYGGVPSVPNPLDSADTATNYAENNAGRLKTLVGGMFPNLDKTIAQIDAWLGGQGPTPTSVSGDVIASNQANLPATQQLLQGIEPTIPATWDIIRANQAGQITRPETNAMTQWGQERGTGGGFGTGNPATNTAIQAALGNTAYQREQLGVQQGQQFGQHLYGMARPFMVTPGEQAGAEQDILKTGVSAAEALGRDVFNMTNQFLPTHGDVQGAQYAANVAKAAPDPEAAAREAERLQNAHAWQEYQLALAAQNRARQQTGRPSTPTAGGGPMTFTLPTLSTPKAKPSAIGPKPTFKSSVPKQPATAVPEGMEYDASTGYYYDPQSGMYYDPVYGAYYDVASGQWLDYPGQQLESQGEGDFGQGFGDEYEYAA